MANSKQKQVINEKENSFKLYRRIMIHTMFISENEDMKTSRDLTSILRNKCTKSSSTAARVL